MSHHEGMSPGEEEVMKKEDEEKPPQRPKESYWKSVFLGAALLAGSVGVGRGIASKGREWAATDTSEGHARTMEIAKAGKEQQGPTLEELDARDALNDDEQLEFGRLLTRELIDEYLLGPDELFNYDKPRHLNELMKAVAARLEDGGTRPVSDHYDAVFSGVDKAISELQSEAQARGDMSRFLQLLDMTSDNLGFRTKVAMAAGGPDWARGFLQSHQSYAVFVAGMRSEYPEEARLAAEVLSALPPAEKDRLRTQLLQGLERLGRETSSNYLRLVRAGLSPESPDGREAQERYREFEREQTRERELIDQQLGHS